MPLSMARRRPKPLAGLAAHSAEVLMLEAAELYRTSPSTSAKFRLNSSVKSRIASTTYPLLTTVLAVAQLDFLPWPRLLRRACETLPGHSWRLILWGSRWACYYGEPCEGAFFLNLSTLALETCALYNFA